MSDTLRRICDEKRLHIAARKQVMAEDVLQARAQAASSPRGFAKGLDRAVAKNGVALVAEIKKASPSKGLIRADFDPPSLAQAYQSGGAACLSVLTDTPYFQGKDAYLASARAAVDLPVLRKDFMLDPYQVLEARAFGADCILLIMAALDDAQARELEVSAFAFGMDVLVEVHNEAELERAHRLDTRLIGINNRDLRSLTVDLATTERLAPLVAPERAIVCESGIATADDIARMKAVGAARFLVGESLMRQSDVTAATRALLAPATTEA